MQSRPIWTLSSRSLNGRGFPLSHPKGHRCSVDVLLLEKVIDKHYGKLRKLLADTKRYTDKHGDFDADFTLIQQEAKSQSEKLLRSTETEQMKQTITSPDTMAASLKLATIQGNIVKNIQNVIPSADKKEIVTRLQHLLSKKKNRNLSEQELSEMIVWNLIGRNTQVPKKNKRKTDVNKLRQNLTHLYSSEASENI